MHSRIHKVYFGQNNLSLCRRKCHMTSLAFFNLMVYFLNPFLLLVVMVEHPSYYLNLTSVAFSFTRPKH